MLWVYGDERVFEVWCRQRGWSTRDTGIKLIRRDLGSVVGWIPKPGDLVIELSFTVRSDRGSFNADTEFQIRRKQFSEAVGYRIDST